ncbi:MAG: AMP-binding protein [Rhodoferax sp.]|nr:AMP-binding protein [Rhodoferax sp.]
MSVHVPPAELPLACLYRWEHERANAIYLTQPMGAGHVLEITWGQAAGEVRCMAQWLRHQGWPPGSRVALMGHNSAYWILADLAITMAGHITVPIFPTVSDETLSYLLLHSESRALFVGALDNTNQLHTGVPPEVPLIALPLAPAIDAHQWTEIVQATRALRESPQPDGEQTCTIIYTSGTTGPPKGVMHTFQSMAWGVRCASQRFPLGTADRFFSYLPLAHVAERMLVQQASLRCGGQVFFAESPGTLLRDLQRARPTVLFTIPSLWAHLQREVHRKVPARALQWLLALPLLRTLVQRRVLRALGLDACRIAAAGAAPMPPATRRWLAHLGLDLAVAYGLTETCGVSHSSLPGVRPGPGGLVAFEGVACRIDALTDEIEVRSPAMMTAYFREAERTSLAFTSDGWLRTGDKGSIDSHGTLHLSGRVRDEFHTRTGHAIAPAPIEEKLINHPAIKACAVTGRNFAQPFALVTLSGPSLAQCQTEAGRQTVEKALEDHLHAVNQQLAPRQRLGFLAAVTTPWTVENGMVTPTHKVIRPSVDAAYGASFGRWSSMKKEVIWADHGS